MKFVIALVLYFLIFTTNSGMAAESKQQPVVSAMPTMKVVAGLLNSPKGIDDQYISKIKGKLEPADLKYVKSISYRNLLPHGAVAYPLNNGLVIIKNNRVVTSLIVKSLSPTVYLDGRDKELQIDRKSIYESIFKSGKNTKANSLKKFSEQLESFFLPTANARDSQSPDEQLDRKIAFLIELEGQFGHESWFSSNKAKAEDIRSVLEKFKIHSKFSCERTRKFRPSGLGAELELSKDGYQIVVYKAGQKPMIKTKALGDQAYCDRSGENFNAVALGWMDYGDYKASKWGIHPDCLLKMDNSGETFYDVVDRYKLVTSDKEWVLKKVRDRHSKRFLDRARNELRIDRDVGSFDLVDDKCVLTFLKSAKITPDEMRKLQRKVEAYCDKNPYLTEAELKKSLPSIKAEYEKGLAVATSLGEGEYFALKRISENLSSCCEDSNCRLAADNAGIELENQSERESSTGAE